MESILLQVQLRLAGHDTRMEDVSKPKAVFFNELQEGKRHRGAPRKPCEDQLKRQLAQAGISHRSWQQEASDRDSWRLSVRKACRSRQRDMKPRRKDALGRKSEQHPNHPQPTHSSVQSAVECVHQKSHSTATHEHARTDRQPSKHPRLRGISQQQYYIYLIITCITTTTAIMMLLLLLPLMYYGYCSLLQLLLRQRRPNVQSQLRCLLSI